MSDVTRILSQIEQGDRHAADQLLPLVYDELRKLAAAKLSYENPGQTLQATALVHEAYLRLVSQPGTRNQEPGASENSGDKNLVPGHRPLAPSFDSRGHFFAAAAEAMRRILVDAARRKSAEKRGGGKRKTLMVDQVAAPEAGDDLIALDEAMAKLAASDAQIAELVKLRYFAGLSNREAAECLGIAPRTADNYWAYAKAWLLREIEGDG